MTTTFVPAAVIERLAALGFRDLDAERDRFGIYHRFERAETCQSLTISKIAGTTFANVWTSHYHVASRRKYPTKPHVHDTYQEALATARATRDELSFLGGHDIELRNVEVYLLSSGRGSWSGRRTVRKTGIYVGTRRAA
jgi:hypothetical protein